jgi:hypothetical protein
MLNGSIGIVHQSVGTRSVDELVLSQKYVKRFQKIEVVRVESGRPAP